jgi:Ca2+-binding EF-hand superfamily protein
MSYSRLSLAAALLLAGPVFAASAGEAADSHSDRAGLFKQIDANGDGQISDDEIPADKRRLFARLLRRSDANADAKLSQDEFIKGLTDERPEAPPQRAGQADGDRFREFLESDPQQAFKQLDTNGDGKIELVEVPQQARGRLQSFFEYYDADRDKALSFDEFRKGHEMLRAQAGISQPNVPQGGGLLRLLDTDGDGALSKEEVDAASQSLRKLDRDNDGAISQRELSVVLPFQAGQPTTSPTQARPNGNQRPDAARLLERLRSMDADGDGKWIESELPPFLRSQFAKLDANQDGFVDSDELRQALPNLRPPQQ